MSNSTNPPAGFAPVPDVMLDSMPGLPPTHFQGPTETGDGWMIEATFTFEDGIELEIQPAVGDYSQGGLTPSQAIEAGNALAALGAKYAGA
ncbi:hypothetical protein [Pseudarthrobacter sp. BIM B-2242]|uniref:hypothetical protein n=1 Tax=Pseudarthrobacter sp. BIM B-2242 TaxID=2772401 RepID=UPI00168B969F|nr:hypothetical protein [Pseudarthrobacter sp. BIM B-2242]QOD04868.1 hypothetical protein IDT60_07590 [Pseudarthrobacter sp. BIM B-2242]